MSKEQKRPAWKYAREYQPKCWVICDSETSPPIAYATEFAEIAELQKQVQALQAELKSKDADWDERIDTAYSRGYDQGYYVKH
jgi:hypothetical protein